MEKHDVFLGLREHKARSNPGIMNILKKHVSIHEKEKYIDERIND